MSLAILLAEFAFCAAIIGVAGVTLTRSADRIGQATGLTGGWVGLALLATVTSLPELASGISAVALVDAPNLAVGNALGACVFNLAFLVVVDAVQRRQPIYREASAAHMLSAAFGVVMLGLVVLALVVGGKVPALLHVGSYSPLLLALYLLALRNVYTHERAMHGTVVAAPVSGRAPSLGREWLRFGVAAATVLVAGTWLPWIADDLAAALGWSRSFVGTLFMAFATTLPEVAVTLSALRLRALDMALGNLLGSNLFNVTILAIDDAAYVRGPLLADAAPVHAGTAVAASVMSGLVMIGLILRPQGRVLRIASWVSIGLLAIYLINAALVFIHGADY